MTTLYAKGSPTCALDHSDLADAIDALLEAHPTAQRILAIPPDHTRLPSRAGELTCLLAARAGSRLKDVLPALGTHQPMNAGQLMMMFPSLPLELVREHRWRTDVVDVGTVPADFVAETTDGRWTRPWPAQLNRLVCHGGHDLIVSLGQVVPHEVIGMANYSKNLFIGTGGFAGIHESHFLSALCGMEQTMGRADTPLRRILNYAEQHFCRDLNLAYVFTVIESLKDGTLVTRGLFVGNDYATFKQAADLAQQCNIISLDPPPQRIVCYLDPTEFHSTWLGNKAIYRTRMAIADDGELIILAPGVQTFGEDSKIDQLIRRHGYQTTPAILEAVARDPELASNLSAAAHLIHGSSEGRFRVTYAPGILSRDEIQSVGYQHAALEPLLSRYPVDSLTDGYHEDHDGQPFYFIRNPALGLWANRSRLA